MSLPDSIGELAARFRYRRDKDGDHWRVMREDGLLHGDCDDFALTALRVVADRGWIMWLWLLTGQAAFWVTRTDTGTPHLHLWVRRRGWIDNIYPQLGRRRWPRGLYVPPPVVAAKMLPRRWRAIVLAVVIATGVIWGLDP